MSSLDDLADLSGGVVDPLAEHEGTMQSWQGDAFEEFWQAILEPKNLTERTLEAYEREFRHWKEHMSEEGRHYSLPNEDHVTSFIQKNVKKGNSEKTIKGKLNKVNAAFEWWQKKRQFPHGTQFNPITTAQEEFAFSKAPEKEHPDIPLNFLKAGVQDITHLRDRAIVMLQLKLGLRATEVCNIELQDLHIANSELLKHYSEMGSHAGLDGEENCIFIPASREGNKSKRSRLLPLDEELRSVLLRYLLIRPDNGNPWLIVSESFNTQLTRETINRTWSKYFDGFDVTSHYGRHKFTTHWRVQENVSKELVQYMRGDKLRSGEGQESMDTYLHVHYRDIEELYRERIYKLLS